MRTEACHADRRSASAPGAALRSTLDVGRHADGGVTARGSREDRRRRGGGRRARRHARRAGGEALRAPSCSSCIPDCCASAASIPRPCIDAGFAIAAIAAGPIDAGARRPTAARSIRPSTVDVAAPAARSLAGHAVAASALALLDFRVECCRDRFFPHPTNRRTATPVGSSWRPIASSASGTRPRTA